MMFNKMMTVAQEEVIKSARTGGLGFSLQGITRKKFGKFVL
jgi:hypothetical protein